VSISIQSSRVHCPACHEPHTFTVVRRSDESSFEYNGRCVETLTKNFTLLSLISTRPSLSVDKSKNSRTFKIGMMCPDHQKPIHSYTDRPFSLLCDECLAEISGLGLNVQPFSEAVQYSKDNLMRALEHVRLKLSRLMEVRAQLESLAGDENHSQLQALESHLDGFHDRLEQERRDARVILSRLHSSLNEAQGKFDKELRSQEEAVSALEVELRSLASLDDFSLVLRHAEVPRLAEQSRKHIPPLEIPDESLKIMIKPVVQEALQQLINSSVQLSLEDDLVETWKCSGCYAQVLEGSVMCPDCHSFRAFTSYPNMLSDPMNVSAKEISELEQRRALELGMISDLDTSNEGKQEVYYIINADWVSEWKCFIFNKPSHVREQNSLNQQLGVLPPGPITNHKLFKDPHNPVDLRPKLKPVAHYRGVNEQVWHTYCRLYGGGPVITRQQLNIYIEPGESADRSTI
jgi:hypothetical protein